MLEAFDFHAAEEAVKPLERPPRVVALDESAFRKRHRYHTIFSDPECGVTFDLAAGRGMGSALEGLLRMNDQVRAGIETVVMDCHWPYRRAVEELLPDARIVVDKFHVIRVIDAAKRSQKLTDRDRQALRAVFEAAPEVAEAWALKELFAAIYDAEDRAEGERRLEDFIEAVERSDIREINNAWRTLQWWRDQILNYLDDPVTNAFGEGITNKIKLIVS